MKYRIVRDNFLGFEAQWKSWWWPFWTQCFGVNTSETQEEAQKIILRHMASRGKSPSKYVK